MLVILFGSGGCARGEMDGLDWQIFVFAPTDTVGERLARSLFLLQLRSSGSAAREGHRNMFKEGGGRGTNCWSPDSWGEWHGRLGKNQVVRVSVSSLSTENC